MYWIKIIFIVEAASDFSWYNYATKYFMELF